MTPRVERVVVDKAPMQMPQRTNAEDTPESDARQADGGPAAREPREPRTAQALTPEALPPGSRLDEFEIVRVLGAGGFGIVYLALDQELLRYVAIKEFIPTSLAGRTASGAVSVRSPEAAETFAIGLDSFYNEGHLLARFDNPSLVRVYRFWKANGTAYMAMQYYPGQTLREARRQMPAPPDEAWFRVFVDRLLGALETLHAEGVYHRDIAPDNILLLPDGQPVILDFGAARRVLSDRTQSLTAILKPNYSPVEQYADDAGMRQGGYTDLYALGGTAYRPTTGRGRSPSCAPRWTASWNRHRLPIGTVCSSPTRTSLTTLRVQWRIPRSRRRGRALPSPSHRSLRSPPSHPSHPSRPSSLGGRPAKIDPHGSWSAAWRAPRSPPRCCGPCSAHLRARPPTHRPRQGLPRARCRCRLLPRRWSPSSCPRRCGPHRRRMRARPSIWHACRMWLARHPQQRLGWRCRMCGRRARRW